MEAYAEFPRRRGSYSWMNLGAAHLAEKGGQSKKHRCPRGKSVAAVGTQEHVARKNHEDARLHGEK